MSNIKLSAFIRVGTILYSLTQFSSLVDVLLEPDKTLKYAYGSLYYDIIQYIEIPVLQTWYIVFVPLLNLLLILGAIMKKLRLIQIYLFISYFSLLMSFPTTFMAVAYANVYSMDRVRDLFWTIFWLASTHGLVKHWKNKSIERDEEIDEILE